MKAFRFTLEAVRTLRQRQEHQALEQYAQALLARQQALDALDAIEERIGLDYARMRRLLAGRCDAGEAAQAHSYHRSLEQRREDGVATLGLAERHVHAASQAMLAARQRREMVEVYRDKQRAAHQRLEWREEQKIQDEFGLRRVTALNSVQTQSAHE
jgi:flagellar export protein FliJ